MLEVSLLGQFEVREDGRRLHIPTRNAQALLAYLLLTAGKVHRREKLAGLLWPDSTEENARSNLRHELWRLRKALPETIPPTLLSDDLTISFSRDAPFTLDVHTLLSAPVEGSSTAELIAAVSAYGGELLPGFYQEWVFVERERLSAAYEARMTRLLEMLQAEERWTELGEWATRWIAAAQWPEPAYRALMFAYAGQGDTPRAIQAYERLRQGLAGELGLEPAEATTALAERIRSGWRPAVVPAVSSQPLVSLSHTARSNLPQPLTSFIGREQEIVQLKELAGSTRLLTIVGPGGMGKTRLSIEAARQVIGHYADGV
ncbi:MAG: BTAD domain-containing putative transcriptional regulator, partial [Candidatus Promineifilaceae bacterium]|nr:BTAD domain-containing putative transcriptional regulator [Candidatus Promineifilaceae bacterium]